jgi:hypothetical protein
MTAAAAPHSTRWPLGSHTASILTAAQHPRMLLHLPCTASGVRPLMVVDTLTARTKHGDEPQGADDLKGITNGTVSHRDGGGSQASCMSFIHKVRILRSTVRILQYLPCLYLVCHQPPQPDAVRFAGALSRSVGIE